MSFTCARRKSSPGLVTVHPGGRFSSRRGLMLGTLARTSALKFRGVLLAARVETTRTAGVMPTERRGTTATGWRMGWPDGEASGAAVTAATRMMDTPLSLTLADAMRGAGVAGALRSAGLAHGE